MRAEMVATAMEQRMGADERLGTDIETAAMSSSLSTAAAPRASNRWPSVAPAVRWPWVDHHLWPRPQLILPPQGAPSSQTWASRALGLFNPPSPTKNLALFSQNILFSQNNQLARHPNPPQPPPPASRHCRVVSPRPARLPSSLWPFGQLPSSSRGRVLSEAVYFFLERDRLPVLLDVSFSRPSTFSHKRSTLRYVQPTNHPCAARPCPQEHSFHFALVL